MPVGIYLHKKGYTRLPFSEQWRKNISLALKGKKKSPRSEEYRRNIGLAHKGFKHSEESKIKISLAQKGKKKAPFTEEHRKNMSKARKGKPSIMLGKHHSEETKTKIRQSNFGLKRSLESKMRISISHRGLDNHQKGKKHTEESKERIRSFHLGKKQSEETKEKRRITMRRILRYRNTSIEIKLQNFLKQNNIEFETHYPISGQPDVFIKPNICIFADGCYWHKCPSCGFGNKRQKDIDITEKLQSQGYIIIRLWEHDINKDVNKLISFNRTPESGELSQASA